MAHQARRVRLHSNGRTYVVRTDESGQEYVLCGRVRLPLRGQMYDATTELSGGALRVARDTPLRQRVLEYARALKTAMQEYGFLESPVPYDTMANMYHRGLRHEDAIKELCRELWCPDLDGPLDSIASLF